MIKTLTVAPNLMHDYMYPVLKLIIKVNYRYPLRFLTGAPIIFQTAMHTCILDASFNLT